MSYSPRDPQGCINATADNLSAQIDDALGFGAAEVVREDLHPDAAAIIAANFTNAGFAVTNEPIGETGLKRLTVKFPEQ